MGYGIKMIRRSVLFLILFLTISCAAITRHSAVVERDEFLNKLPMLNNEILGELKYDNPDLDLSELGIKNYSELFGKVDLTENYKKVISFMQNNVPDRKFVVQRNTFIICLRSESYMLILCDDAATPSIDKIRVTQPIPTLNDFYSNFLKGADLKKKIY